MTFENINKELDDIIKRLEQGTPLDEGVALFSRGSELVKEGYKLLDTSRGKLTIIQQELGEIVEKELK